MDRKSEGRGRQRKGGDRQDEVGLLSALLGLCPACRPIQSRYTHTNTHTHTNVAQRQPGTGQDPETYYEEQHLHSALASSLTTPQVQPKATGGLSETVHNKDVNASQHSPVMQYSKRH